MKNFYLTGDNLAFLASDIVAPAHTLGDNYTNLVGPGVGATIPVNLVESGDPVVIGRHVGVANQDALFSTDTVIISTRGVYSLAVKANYGAGIHNGETIYINPSTAALSDDSTGIPFGVAYSAGVANQGTMLVINGSTTTILVKLFGLTDGAIGFGS